MAAYPAPQTPHHQPGQQGEHQRQADETTRGNQPQAKVAGLQPQQQAECPHACQHRDERRGLQAAQTAAQHRQGRYARQLQNRGQAKGQQQHHARRPGEQRGRPAGRWQLAHLNLNQPVQQPDHRRLHRQAEQHPQRRRKAAQPDKLGGVATEQNALTQPQGLEHRAGLQASARKVAGRLRHRHSGHERGDQRHQMQKIRGALERLFLRRAAVGHGFHPHAARGGLANLLLRPLGVGGRCLRWPSQREAISHPAGGLDQPGSGQIGAIHHHPRGEIDEARAGIGLAHQNGRDAQPRIAQLQQITHLQPQSAEHTGIHPNRTGLGRPAARHLRRLQPVAQHHLRDQGVMRAHRLERDQPGAVTRDVERHAGKHRRLHRAQPLRLRVLQIQRFQRMIADDHHVATDQLRSIAHQRALQPLGDEAHGRQRGHGQHQREEQEPQFAAAPVTPKLSQGLHRGRPWSE